MLFVFIWFLYLLNRKKYMNSEYFSIWLRYKLFNRPPDLRQFPMNDQNTNVRGTMWIVRIRQVSFKGSQKSKFETSARRLVSILYRYGRLPSSVPIKDVARSNSGDSQTPRHHNYIHLYMDNVTQVTEHSVASGSTWVVPHTMV